MLASDTRSPGSNAPRPSAELAGAVVSMTQGVLAHHAQTAARIERVVAIEPGAAIGHAVRGFALCLQMRTDLGDAIATSVLRAEVALHERGGSDLEQALTTATRAYAAGRPIDAVAVLDARVARAPTDLLALKLAHALHFLLGDTAGLRRAADTAVHGMPDDLAMRGYAMGCQAFAHIESGDVESGERIGRAAVDREPDDAWGVHAVAHALATRGRAHDGIAWLRTCAPHLAGVNNFGGHVAWHQALCHLTLGQDDEALALYDERVAVNLAGDYRDVVNATTLLHRLRRRGHDVRDRAARVAAHVAARRGDHGSAFGDIHYAMAIAEHDAKSARAFAGSMRAAAVARDTHEAAIARSIACDLVDALVAMREGRRSAHLFEAGRAHWPTLGGSRIQRETFQLLFEEAVAHDTALEGD